MNDVRDEALGAKLEQVASRIESVPVDRLPEVLRRGSRMRAIRFTAIAAAVAIFVGTVSWVGLQNEGRGTIPADIADWNTFASLEENGWTIQFPPSWRVQELPSCPNAPDRIGVILTSVDFEFLNPRGESPQCEDRFVFDGFPSDGVAFAFMPVGIRFGIVIPQPDTVFPLSPDRLMKTDSISPGVHQSFLDVWEGTVILASVSRWVGPDASAADIDALDRVLASLQVRSGDRWTETEGGLTTLHDEKDDYVITYPAYWIVAEENLTPWLSEPGEILSLGTFPLRVSEDPDDGLRLWTAPVAPFALADMTSQDVFVSLQESGTDVGLFDPRPGRFGPLGCEDAIYGCRPSKDPDLPDAARNVPFRAWWIPFQDSGRGFYLFVAIGKDAPPELREEAWAVADSLAFDPDAG
jgi:hypothetical protein